MFAKKYDIPGATLKNWVDKYKFGGFDNLSKKLKNNKFTSEFKLSILALGKSLHSTYQTLK